MRSGSGRKTTSRLAVLTIGHSTHTLAKFVAMLKAHNVVRIVDVRSIPKSRHVPQFDRQTLAAHLRAQELAMFILKASAAAATRTGIPSTAGGGTRRFEVMPITWPRESSGWALCGCSPSRAAN